MIMGSRRVNVVRMGGGADRWAQVEQGAEGWGLMHTCLSPTYVLLAHTQHGAY